MASVDDKKAATAEQTSHVCSVYIRTSLMDLYKSFVVRLSYNQDQVSHKPLHHL